MPPLHRIEVSGRGGKAGEVIYTYSDAEMRETVTRLKTRDATSRTPCNGSRVLARWTPNSSETTMDPGARLLRRVTASDVEAATEVFDLLMGSEVAPRKDFIIAGAADLDRERIDV